MKQKMDEVRTLAIKLYKAGQKEKRKASKSAWGRGSFIEWKDLRSESVAVWDAVATASFCHFNGKIKK